MMKRLILLCLCATLLVGCTRQTAETDSPETTGAESSSSETVDETETAETETKTAETETESAKTEPAQTEPASENSDNPAAAHEITLDPAAKGYIYVYAYPSPISPDTTMYYCTDTPLMGSAMDGTQKEKPDGTVFATNTSLPSALGSETAENTAPTAEDIATLTLRDVISCTAAYPEYAYVSTDAFSDGYLFYHDSTWMAYRLTDGTALPLTHANVGCVSKPKSMQVSCVPLAKCAQIWHNIANPNKGVAQYGKTI